MIKKRTIIAIIITIVTIIATNKLWLIFKPMTVDFDIKGKGQCNIEVQLNKKDNDKFNKIKTQNILLDLNKDTHASFNVKRSRFPKRIKFIITGLEDNSPVEISNITFRNDKYKLDDLKQFSNSTGELGIKNNSLIIYPDNNVINLEYKKTLNARTAIKFDFKVFVIILILTYLLAYKLSNYVADFKTVKGKSRIEIIFLTIFFVFLFIPMSNISQENISKQENRTLAKYKPFINQDGEINYDYGKNFNEWFNDRFYLRKNLVDIYNKVFNKYIRYNEHEGLTYLNKNNNFIFTDNIWNSNNLWIEPNQQDYKQYLSTYKQLYEYAQKQHLALYIVAVPTKEKALIKYQDCHIKSYENETERVSYIQKYLKEYSSEYEIVYPLEDLTNNYYAYYKTDHHYTDYGASLVAKALFKSMQKDTKDLIYYDKFKYNYDKFPHGTWDDNPFEGSLYNRLSLTDKKIFDVDYKYFDLTNTDIKINSDDESVKKTYTNKNAPNNQKLYIIGDSFSHSLGKCLAYSFKQVVLRRDNMGYHKLFAKELLEDVEREKPSILVFVYVSPHIDRFLKTFYSGE